MRAIYIPKPVTMDRWVKYQQRLATLVKDSRHYWISEREGPKGITVFVKAESLSSLTVGQ